MACIKALTLKPVLEFEGGRLPTSRLWSDWAFWCSAAACTSAKAGYIISHQNRGWR